MRKLSVADDDNRPTSPFASQITAHVSSKMRRTAGLPIARVVAKEIARYLDFSCKLRNWGKIAPGFADVDKLCDGMPVSNYRYRFHAFLNSG